jgi:hypothetical protein
MNPVDKGADLGLDVTLQRLNDPAEVASRAENASPRRQYERSHLFSLRSFESFCERFEHRGGEGVPGFVMGERDNRNVTTSLEADDIGVVQSGPSFDSSVCVWINVTSN